MTSLLRHHRTTDLVAFGDGGERTSGDLLRDAAKIAAALPRATEGSQVAVVFESDRYAFAVAMLGAWLAGHAVAVGPHGGPRIVAGLLERPEVVALVHDTLAQGHLQVDAVMKRPGLTLIPTVSLPATLVVAYREAEHTRVEPYPGLDARLLRAVQALGSAHEARIGERYWVTVPPTDLHGLVHGVLLPLCTGGAFSRAIEPAEAFASRPADGPCTLVTVPGHLRTLWRSKALPAAGVRAVISSTTALDERLQRELGTAQIAVLDVLSAREAGPLAWRRGGDDAWAALAGRAAAEGLAGRLCIEEPEGRRVVTRERVELRSDGTFVHLGREDEVLELDGERVALSRVRARLAALDGVDDVEVVGVVAPTPRVLVAAVAPGVDDAGLRSAIVEAFGVLDGRLDVRRFGRLPRDGAGRIRRRTMTSLFGLGPDGRPASRALLLEAPEHDGAQVKVRARVPVDYVHFEGHFDDYPILAGVVQLHELLLPLVARIRPDLGELSEMQQVKFLGRIAPGDELVIGLRFAEDAPACDFEIVSGTRRCSAGRLRFAAPVET